MLIIVQDDKNTTPNTDPNSYNSSQLISTNDTENNGMIEQTIITETRRTTEATMRMEHIHQPDIPMTFTQNTQTCTIPVISEGTMSEQSTTASAATNTDQTATATDSTQTPPQVPPKPQASDEITLIDTTSISKNSSLEFFSNKIKTDSMPPVTEEKYTKFEDLKKPTLHISVPNSTDATRQLQADLAELNLIPGSPPEIGYMPKMQDTKREQIFDKIKKLEEIHRENVDAPSGGVQTLPPPVTKTETIVNQAFIQNSNVISQPTPIVNVPFTVFDTLPQHPIVQHEEILHQTSMHSTLFTPTEPVIMRPTTPTTTIGVASNSVWQQPQQIAEVQQAGIPAIVFQPPKETTQMNASTEIRSEMWSSVQPQVINQVPITLATEIKSGVPAVIWPPLETKQEHIINGTSNQSQLNQTSVNEAQVENTVPVPQQETLQQTLNSTTEIRKEIWYPQVSQSGISATQWPPTTQVQHSEQAALPSQQPEQILNPTPEINIQQSIVPPWLETIHQEQHQSTNQQYFTTTEPIMRPQAHISEPEKQQNGLRSPSPRPSAEGVAMEKLWSSPKSTQEHEKQFDSSFYHTSKNEFAEEKIVRKFSSVSESDTDYKYESASETDTLNLNRRRSSTKETAKMFEEKIKEAENSPRHDYDLKAPGLVKQILPRPQQPDRPKSVQESLLPDIHLEPGSPPEICYAPRTPTRKQSLAETFEQTIEKNMEKGPTRVLPGAVRMIPPAVVQKEETKATEIKPIIPPKPIDLQQTIKPIENGSFPFYSSCDEKLFESQTIQSTQQSFVEYPSAPQQPSILKQNQFEAAPNNSGIQQFKQADQIKHKPKLVSGYMADTEDTMYTKTMTSNKENIETTSKRIFESYSNHQQTNINPQPSQAPAFIVQQQPTPPPPSTSNKHYRHFTHKHDQKDDETFGQYEKVRLCAINLFIVL